MLNVIYRACPLGADKERPINPKIKLIDYCFESFVKAFEDVEYTLTVLMDKPTPELRSIFKQVPAKYVEEYYFGNFTEGNVGTFHRQIDLALEGKTNFLFVEDDYYFLPGSGKKIAAGIECLPYITPYDHCLYYIEEKHRYARDIKLVGDQHWGSVTSTTLTFGGQYLYLKKDADTMKKYGWVDSEMWEDITQRSKLYAPIPTLATHMETPYLAPGIQFENL